MERNGGDMSRKNKSRKSKGIALLLAVLFVFNQTQGINVQASGHIVQNQLVQASEIQESAETLEEVPEEEEPKEEKIKSEEVNEKVYELEKCQIAVLVNARWDNKANISFTIKNTGEETIQTWALKMVSDWNIREYWCANMNQKEDGSYIIFNQDYNCDIAAGCEVQFGLEIEYPETGLNMPELSLLETEVKKIDSITANVTYTISSEWGEGYIMLIQIKNESTQPIKDWYLEFDYADVNESIWNATVMRFIDGQYVLKYAPSNQVIQPGEEIEIGMGFNKKRGENVPSNFNLSCTEPIEEQKCTVSFDLNYEGAVNDIQPIKVVVGTSFTEEIEPVREGYEFDGWYFEPECENLYWAEYDTFDEDTTLYAGWRNQFVDLMEEAYRNLSIGYQEEDAPNCITKDIQLPREYKNDIKVKWTSSNPSVISEQGVVTRPDEVSAEVVLVAELSVGDLVKKKNFVVKVIKTYQPTITQLQDYDLEDLVVVNEGVVPRIVMKEDSENIESLIGCFSNVVIETKQEAQLALFNVKTLLGCQDPKNDLVCGDVTQGNYSTTYKFFQKYQGLVVYGKTLRVIVDRFGKASALYNCYDPNIVVNIQPTLTEEEIRTKIQGSNEGESLMYNIELCIYATINQTYVLAYKVDVVAPDESRKNQTYYMDAVTGDFLIHTTEQSVKKLATGTDLLGNTYNDIPYVRKKDKEGVVLQDEENKINIYTRNNEYKDGYCAENSRVTTNKIANGAFEFEDKIAISAYKNILQTNQFYSDVLGRDYFISTRDSIDVVIHEPSKRNNASWALGVDCFLFGDGTEDFEHETAAYLEIVAHEYTHGVIGDLTQLDDWYDSVLDHAGVNEGIADIFGCLVQGYSTKNFDWCMLDGVRNETDRRDAKHEQNLSQILDGEGLITDSFRKNKDLKYMIARCINRATYLMYTREIPDPYELARLWYETLVQQNFGVDFELRDLPEYVLGAAETMHMTIQQKDCIRKAFIEVGFKEAELEVPTGSCSFNGTVVEADEDTNMSNNQALADVDITIAYTINGEKFEKKTKTEQDGTFTFDKMLPMQYTINFKKDGYLPEDEYVLYQQSKIVMNDAPVELIPERYKGVGTASGKVTDATNGLGVKDLTINIRKGINNHTGNTVKTDIKTGEEGIYTTGELEAGNYCLEIIDERIKQTNENEEEYKNYIRKYFNIKVLGNLEITDQNTTVTDQLGQNSIRIVLEWDKTIRDLDLHLVYEDNADSNKNYHVAFYNKNVYMEDEIVANLDVDDTNCDGPETITVNRVQEGKYTCYVHAYSSQPEMITSDVVIYLYFGDQYYEYRIPKSKNGRIWTVFSIDAKDKVVKKIDVVGDEVKLS